MPNGRIQQLPVRIVVEATGPYQPNRRRWTVKQAHKEREMTELAAAELADAICLLPK